MFADVSWDPDRLDALGPRAPSPFSSSQIKSINQAPKNSIGRQAFGGLIIYDVLRMKKNDPPTMRKKEKNDFIKPLSSIITKDAVGAYISIMI